MREHPRLGRYQLLEEIGAGGMGVVYRARDERLGRDVAVKILPESFATDADRVRRFEREARAAAALDHPNILAIHDVGTWEGRPYIVTELLAGETLRQRIEAGDLTIRKAVELGVQIAKGLSAAHERGIVHRDLKPGNVFVTSDGAVKILDFGLAKLTQLEAPAHDLTGAPTEPPPTASDAVLGTAGYMAPEQIRGQPADHRADIFALGCVLYEMLSGRRAFKGATPADTSAAILSSDPEPLSEVNPQLPSGLETIVERCLQKRPEDRFQSARDVAFALQAATSLRATGHRSIRRRWIAVRLPLWAAVLAVLAGLAVGLRGPVGRWFGVVPLPAVKRLAVLGLAAVESDAELAAIASGLGEVIERGLRVIEQDLPTGHWTVPRREARIIAAESIEDLRRKFNVSLVVTGQLSRSGESFRCELAAVDPVTARALRSTVAEDRVSNVASFQEDLVARVARMLEIDVPESAANALIESATTMAEPYTAYLAATGLLNGGAKGAELDQAIGLFRRALALDPLFDAARIGLGRSYLRWFEGEPDEEWLDSARNQAERVAVGGRSAEAYQLLAAIATAGGRHPDAVQDLRRAAQIAPADAEINLELAAALQAAGDLNAAERELQRAIFLRPGYWPGHHLLAKLYMRQNRFEAAATQWREVIACAPEFTRGYNNLGMVCFYLGRSDEAQDAFERSLAIEPSRYALSNLGTLYFEGARFADAAAMYERALAEDDSSYETWGNLGYACRYSGAPDRADEAFRRAVGLGEEVLAQSPRDLAVATNVAGYHAMLGQREKGLALLEPVIEARPTEQILVAQVAENLWDLGDRDRALDWVRRAFEAGAPRRRFEERPTLRDLVADERYQRLVANLDRRP